MCCSGFDDILKPNQIKATLGLHRISDFKKHQKGDSAGGGADGGDDTAANTERKDENSITSHESAYEMEIKNIFVHRNYVCRKPNNDIGTK